MAYNTGNPLGSSDPKDLYDNAANLDAAVNNLGADNWIDRFGVERLTWEGLTRLSNLGAAVIAAERAEAAAEAAEQLVAGNTYLTKEIADAAQPLPEGTMGRVTNDPDPNNNGYWVSDGSQWIWSELQFATKKQVQDALDVLNSFAKFSDGSDTHNFVDSEGGIVARLDKFGELHLVGLDGSLQQAIRRPEGSDDVFLILDSEGGIVARLDRDGSFFLVGLDENKSVQESINEKTNVVPEATEAFGHLRQLRDNFSDDVAKIFANRASTQPSAPAPMNALPQSYSLGTGWINSLKTTEPQPTPINTTYRDNDGVVHPYLCEFYNGFRGYRYILGITGYYNTNENEENPFVFGSNDLVTFELLDGFQQPLADRPDVPSGHNSDIFFTYDPRTGELICCWRQSIRNSPPENVTMDAIWCRKTLDGYTWSDPEIVVPPVRRGDDILLSPSILFDPATFTWHMYEVKTRYIQHRTAKSLHGPWTEPTRIAVPSGVTPWHLDVRWCGDKQVMLIHDNGNGTGPDNLYFGVSEGDFLTWHIGTTPVVDGVTLGMYKATFVPTFDEEGRMAMDIIWTGDAGPGTPETKWRLLVNRTNFVEIQ